MKNVGKLQKDKHTKFKEDIFFSNPNLKFKKIIINSNYSIMDLMTYSKYLNPLIKSI